MARDRASPYLRPMTVHDRVIEQMRRGPHRTALQLAEAVFGDAGYQQRVNGACLWLLRHGQAERVGRGGPADPYRYSLAGARNA
jgi:hypothetical protein